VGEEVAPRLRRAPRWAGALLVAAALAGAAMAASDASIGVCTKRDEFAKRQEALDPKVAQFTKETSEAKRKALLPALVKAADSDIECLMRYREPALVPVFVEVLRTHKKWFTRTRAICALKSLGDAAAVPALAAALADKDAMVREAAANALGHLGGGDACAALEKAKASEKDAYVVATLDAALATASSRPYEGRKDGKEWKEPLVGPEGAKRVEWAWVKKGGSPLFNDYDATALDTPLATAFVYPVLRYKEDLFAGYPRNSFGAGGNHAGEDHAWFREGCSYYAIGDGVVRMVQGAGGDWGFLVLVEHRLGDGRFVCSVYGHAAFDVLVKPGDAVKAGQRLATEGLSCSVENGGYGSHLHFGLGDGPFRRPSKVATGDVIDFDWNGKPAKGPVLRLVYAKDGKGSRGWPLTAAVCKAPDGSETEVVFPEEDVKAELTWFQAYVKDCRGWLDPQKLLLEWVEKKR
jgi:murein DD-endopeptidase MepM/ murein hydrolase activator NlpD